MIVDEDFTILFPSQSIAVIEEEFGRVGHLISGCDRQTKKIHFNTLM
jgi:hypothetical protein